MSPQEPIDFRPRELVVDDRHAGQRIDNFLTSHLKGVPRAHIYRILRRGEVRVNRGRIRQHYRLQPGDVVRLPPVRALAAVAPAKPPRDLLDDLASRVLFEDDCLLVLDKPAGLAVHGGSGVSLGLIEALRAGRPGERFLELAHRLDRETSGCLMIARRRSALVAVHEALRDGTVDKRYLALTQGRWRRSLTVDGSLRRDVLRSGERMVREVASGKAASTGFRPLATASGTTLVEAVPHTGRTHQIRVHASSAGHPVAGDEKYGDREFNRRLREHGLRRLFLHAAGLRLRHPAHGGELHVRAALPAELVAVTTALGLRLPGGLDAGAAARAAAARA